MKLAYFEITFCQQAKINIVPQFCVEIIDWVTKSSGRFDIASHAQAMGR
jgi:hypothetical protein